MAASSAMMAANPFALVSPRPPIIEGGKYRITWVDGHDEPQWMAPESSYSRKPIWRNGEIMDRSGFANDPVPGLKWLTNFDSFNIDPKYEDEEWYMRDIQLEDKAAFRHFIVGHMEGILSDFEGEEPWLKGGNDIMNAGGDCYYDTYPFWIRHCMIGAGIINDRKLWDWFQYHPYLVNQYPLGDDDDLNHRDKYWNWDDLWVDNKMWGPAAIKKIG